MAYSKRPPAFQASPLGGFKSLTEAHVPDDQTHVDVIHHQKCDRHATEEVNPGSSAARSLGVPTQPVAHGREPLRQPQASKADAEPIRWNWPQIRAIDAPG